MMASGRSISVAILVVLLFVGAGGQASAFKLPDTGQTSSYAAWDDGAYSINPLSFTNNGNGTVTDNNTGLIWQQEDDGVLRAWDLSDTYCKTLTLPGTGWRLPTKKELMSIVDFSAKPAVSLTYFPGAQNWQYPTSTVPAFNAAGRWSVDFGGMGIDAVDISAISFYTRCVRGSTSGAWGSLSDNGDGTVVDTGNNFIWQKTEGGPQNWNAALNYCNNLSLAGYSDWRLPNVKELESLTDDGAQPTFSRSLFPGLPTPQRPYWSSTTDAFFSGRAWFILSGYGRIYSDATAYGFSGYKTDAYEVRCVRGGQSAALVKLSVSRSGTGTGTVTGSLGGISCGSKCSAYFDSSASLPITLTATPSASSTFTSWTGCNTVNANVCTVTVSGAKTVTATFTQSTVQTYQLTVSKTGSGTVTSSPSGISCGTACSGSFAAGAVVTLSASPEAGWSLSGWSGCDNSSGNTCTVAMNAGRSVSATFTSGTGTPQLIVSKTGNGSVTSTPAGINCGETCIASFSPGTPVTLTATPASGTRIGGWNGCDSVIDNACTVTVSGQTNVSVSFLWGRTLTVARSGGGLGVVLSKPSGIRCGDDCSEIYQEGSGVTLIAVPDTGSSFAGWSGTACSGTGIMCRVTMNADTSVGAAFDVAEVKKANTRLSMALSAHSVLKTGVLYVGGRLTRLPDLGNDLGNLPIKLKITAPDGTTTTRTASTMDRGGLYLFPVFAPGSLKGAYTLQAVYEGNDKLMPSSSRSQTVVVNNLPGYAVIVEGSIPGGEGLPNHNKTTNRIYESLKERGFTDDNIMYFNTRPPDGVVDDTPSKQDIAEAVKTWAASKMNALAGPFYLIMVDHGDSGTFYIGEETLSRDEVASWLDTLEGGLNTSAKADPRIVIIGSCYSGSFIPALSKAGRVIITSARADEQSYKGPMEEDTIRSGEFFMDELFDQLKKGQDMRGAFESSSVRTMAFTRSGAGRLYDSARQHPLLDDNGDGRGNTILAARGDGTVALGLYLGYGDTYSPTSLTNPAELTAVNPTLFLDSATSNATLWARANQNSLVSSAWAEVKSPAAALSAASNQLDLNLPRLPLVLTGPAGRWEGIYNAFTASGTHEVYYFVSDTNTSKTTSMMKSVVYKDREGNTPPSGFSLLSPAEDSYQSTVLTFDWEDSADPDGLTYTLLLSRKEDLSTIDYRKEEIPYSSAVVGVDDNLSDVTIWYWKVYAIDSYGARTESSQTGSFITINNNTNGLASIVTGYVTNGVTGSALPSATVKLSAADSGIPVLDDGFYFTKVEAGSITVSAEAPGYGVQVIEASPAPGEVLEMNFNLTPANPCAATLGDDLSLHVPVVDAGGAYLWVDLIYDPARTDAVVFELKTGYGLLTDVAAFSSCQPATFGSGDGGATWKLSIPEIFFGTMRLWADMVLETGGGNRILFDVTGAGFM